MNANRCRRRVRSAARVADRAGVSIRCRERAASVGFTLVEVLIVLAIISTLLAIAVPLYETDVDQAREARAATEIRMLEDEITNYESNNGQLPDDLSQVGYPNFLDPWHNPYVYLNHADATGKGKFRKDRFLVPLNSDYDLYSQGKNRASQPPITSAPSQDDILRASNGSYVGLASQF